MEKGWHHIATKQKELDDFIRFHETRVQPPVRSSSLRVYISPLPKELGQLQANYFLVDRDLYKEDHGTFLLLISSLQHYWSTPTPREADYILVPFDIYFHEKLGGDLLDRFVGYSRAIAGDKPLIFFCLGDFCRKTAVRSTSFERRLFQGLPGDRPYVPGWIREDDIIIHFESTIDFIFNDIPVFPLIQLDPVDPMDVEKQYLFSFTGQYYKEGWPDDFVRGSAYRPVWAKLKTDNPVDAFIGPPDSRPSWSEENPFFEIPGKSVFTLCPRGIACWSFRVFEAILSGSIPVILSDSYVRPFSEFVPWDYFSLHFPEASLPDIRTLLGNIQPAVIRSMTRHLRNNQHWFTANGLTGLIIRKLESRLSFRS